VTPFQGFIPLNAANFESGNALAGQVLTANGAGGAAWHAAGATDVTYADLVSAINGATLTPGRAYRITDFVTRHYIAIAGVKYATVTGPNEPLVVQAIAADQLSPLAWSALYPQDIIYYDWNPANWLTDNSFAISYSYEIIPDWKGVVIFRHDTVMDTYAPGDWRHCKTRRWKPAPTAWSSATPYAIGDVVGRYNCAYVALQSSLNISPMSKADNDYWLLLRDYGTQPYQMADQMIQHGIPSGPEYADFLLFNGATAPRSVHIAPFVDNEELGILSYTLLPGSVFFKPATTYSCNFGSGFWLNTFMGNTSTLDFAGMTSNNHFVNAVYSVQAGHNFAGNSIGHFMEAAVCGLAFAGNRIGAQFRSNQIGPRCSGNLIGQLAQDNVIGADFTQNTMRTYFQGNEIGCQISGNTIGIYFKNQRVASGALVNQNLSAATHVYAYPCHTFKRSDGSVRLSYVDASDVVHYAAVTD